MGQDNAFDQLFADASASEVAQSTAVWKILLVDDEPDIRAVLRLALQDVRVEGRGLQLFEASSVAEAQAVLAAHEDMALVLLDVVMETGHSGLDLVRHIRDTGNHALQIILVTGQPGYAPEREIITDYEINGYRLKSELTADRIFISVYTALRAHQTLLNLQGTKSDLIARIEIEKRLNAMLDQQVQLNKKLEEAHNQLLQSEKMASIGQLAAGVAHELNNPIGFVSSNLVTLDSYLRDMFAVLDAYAEAEAVSPQSCAQMEQARALKVRCDFDFLRGDIVHLMAESRDGLNRVSKIVRDLKDFSRVDEPTLQWADLHAGLDSTLNIVWNELKYKCEVVKAYGCLPMVLCVPSQLNQVFMNLLVNASHAIADKGTITIRTGREGERVFVAISDTGSGIAPEHLKRIFDPFFTTKPVGQGTGLGLSVSYSIIQRHGGEIVVASQVGEGTTFTVWLPIEAVAGTPSDAVPHAGHSILPPPTFSATE